MEGNQALNVNSFENAETKNQLACNGSLKSLCVLVFGKMGMR